MDEFIIVVPADAETAPFLVEQGDGDLSPYVGDRSFHKTTKVVALKNGTSVTGAIYRARELTRADDMAIMHLLNGRFNAS